MDNNNFTMDNSSELVEFCPKPAWCFVDLMVVIAVTYLILIGNIGTLVVLVSTESLRNNSHGYVLISLAVADFGVGVVAAMAIYPAATFEGPEAWLYGDAACAVTAVSGHVFLATSSNSLTVLSVERYLAIAHPLRYSRLWTKKASLLCVAGSWAMGVAMYLPLVILSGYEYVPELHTCMSIYRGNFVIVLALELVLVVPSVFTIVLTSCIVNRKLKESARLRAMPANAAFKDSASETLRAFRMVRVMTIAVLVCWLPYDIVSSCEWFGVEIPRELFFFAYWLFLSNSFFNTIIYILMNKTFRAKLHDLVRSVVPKFCLKLGQRVDRECRCCQQLQRTADEGGQLENSVPKRPDDCHHEVSCEPCTVSETVLSHE